MDFYEKLGFTKVDELLNNAGRVIRRKTRERKKKRENDLIAHRVHESAGDEFMIFVPLAHSKENDENVLKIAERILEAVHKA